MNPAEYGKALFLLAKEEGLTERIMEEAEAVVTLLSKNPKYTTLLDTPAVPTGEKTALLDTAFSDLHPHLLSFLKILVSKRSVYLFPRAFSAFKGAYEEENNILHAHAVSAVALSEKQNQALTEKLCKITGKNVILHNRVEKELLGGIRLQFDGKQLDSSLEAQLASLRKSLKQSTL